MGLMRAVDKYDVSLGYKFSTYANLWVRASISECIPAWYLGRIASKIIKMSTRLVDTTRPLCWRGFHQTGTIRLCRARRWIRNADAIVVPRRVRAASTKALKAGVELQAELGRDPTTAEVTRRRP